MIVALSLIIGFLYFSLFSFYEKMDPGRGISVKCELSWNLFCCAFPFLCFTLALPSAATSSIGHLDNFSGDPFRQYFKLFSKLVCLTAQLKGPYTEQLLLNNIIFRYSFITPFILQYPYCCNVFLIPQLTFWQNFSNANHSLYVYRQHVRKYSSFILICKYYFHWIFPISYTSYQQLSSAKILNLWLPGDIFLFFRMRNSWQSD